MNSTSKILRKRNQATRDLLASMAELQGYVDRGMKIGDIVGDIRRWHPERVHVMFRPPAPKECPPARVKKLREAMGMSQATFAEVLGVSRILVQSWERGVREPSALARRLLDTIREDPAAWLASLRRRAG